MHWIMITRPLNLLQATLAVLITVAFLDAFGQSETLVLLVLSVVCINAGGNVINDIYDIDIDRVNRPQRALPAGLISVRAAWIYTLILFGTGTILASMLSWQTFIIAGPLSVGLLSAYSMILKRQPLIGNLTVSFMLALAFIYVGSAFHRIPDTLVMAALAFGFTLIRELVKDLEDMEGDARDQARTLPLVWGEAKTLTLVMFLMVAFMVLDLLPYFWDVYSGVYFWLVLLGINLPLALAVLRLWQAPGKRIYAAVQLFLKLDIFVGLAALYFGRII